MGRQKLTAAQSSFSSGLNLASDPASVGQDQLTRADNCRLTARGAVTKRRGSVRLHASALPAAVKGGFCWQRATAADQLLAVANGTLYTGAYPTLPAAMSWTAQTGSLSTTQDVSFAAFRDGSGEAVYLADGGALAKWNGTALSRPAGAATVAYVWVYNQRLFGISLTSETIYWSALNNGDSLGNVGAGGGSGVVRTFGAERLTGGAAWGGVSMLLHEGGVSTLSGLTQDDINLNSGLTGLSRVGGTFSPFGVVALPAGLWVVSPVGILLVRPDGVQRLDTPEKPDPCAPILAALPQADLAGVRAVRSEATQEVWVSLPTLGVYVWHEVLGAWAGPWDSGYLAPATTCLFAGVDDAGKPCVLRGDASGWVSRCDPPDVHTDNAPPDTDGVAVLGTPYTMVAGCRRFYAEDMATGARDLVGQIDLRRVWVYADLQGSTTASVLYVTPNDAGVATLTDQSPPAALDDPRFGLDDPRYGLDGSGYQPHDAEVGGTGPYVDVQFVDSGTGEPSVAGVRVEAFSLGHYR
jgi:hypothetical protein